MRPEGDGVQPPPLPQLVQTEQVGIDIVGVVGVGGVVLQVPLSWGLHVFGWPPLRPALIINHVQPHNLHKPRRPVLAHAAWVLLRLQL